MPDLRALALQPVTMEPQEMDDGEAEGRALPSRMGSQAWVGLRNGPGGSCLHASQRCTLPLPSPALGSLAALLTPGGPLATYHRVHPTPPKSPICQ